MLTLVLIIIILLCGCGSGGAGSGGYFVSFTLDGTDYVLSRGYIDHDTLDDGAQGSIESGSGRIEIAAAGDLVTDTFNDGPALYLRIEGTVPGDYQFDAADSEGTFSFKSDDPIYYRDVNGENKFSLTLSSVASEVGGVISGTFSGSVYTGPVGSEVEKILSNGYFFVERIADDTISAPFN